MDGIASLSWPPAAANPSGKSTPPPSFVRDCLVDGLIKYIFVVWSFGKKNVGRKVACKVTFRVNSPSDQLEAKST